MSTFSISHSSVYTSTRERSNSNGAHESIHHSTLPVHTKDKPIDAWTIIIRVKAAATKFIRGI